MANMAQTGIRWVKSRQATARQPIEERFVASNNTLGIFAGDAVKLAADGTVLAAAAGDSIYGICNGAVRYKSSSGVVMAGNFLPAATVYTGAPSLVNPTASVISCTPAQGQVFEADVDTAVASITAAQDLMNNNADIVATAGNVSTGRSAHVINGASGTGTATAQWRLLEVVPSPDNDVTAANWKVRMTINESTEPLAGVVTGT